MLWSCMDVQMLPTRTIVSEIKIIRENFPTLLTARIVVTFESGAGEAQIMANLQRYRQRGWQALGVTNRTTQSLLFILARLARSFDRRIEDRILFF